MAVRLVNVEEHNFTPDPSYAVGVILLGCPPPTDLFERCVGSTSDVKARPFTKCINMLTISQNGLRAVGGNWVPELDGQDPTTNPQTLINTAIRTCKDMVGLDLSECTRWYRFLEFRYSRSEGQAWPSVDQMFAKGERWGVAYGENGGPSSNSASSNRQSTSTPSSANASGNKPVVVPTSPTPAPNTKDTKEEDTDDLTPHRVVVYYIPDIWSIMPDKSTWDSIKSKYQDPKSYCTPKDPASQSQCGDSGTDKETDAQGDTECMEKEVDRETNTSGKNEAAKTMDTSEDTLRMKKGTVPSDPEDETQYETDTAPKPHEEEEEDPRKLHHSKIDINALKVSELREQLSVRKLDTSGLKNQLSNRLKVALQNEADEEEKRRKDEEERAAQAAAAAAKAEVATKEAAQATSSTSEAGGEAATKGAPSQLGSVDVAKSSATEGGKPEIKLPVLPEQPSLIVQLKPDSTCQLVVCSLETIITLSKGNYMPSNQVYELFICANHILHMFHRDATFTLYKALVVLSDRKQLRSAQNASKPASAALKTEAEQPSHKKPRLASGDAPSSDASAAIHKALKSSGHDSQQKMKVIDLPLLFACKLLDVQTRGYFSLYNLETSVSSLALPISRYQIRALCHNVIDDNKRLHYRCLTDVPDPAATPVGVKDGCSRSGSYKRPHDQLITEHLELNGTPISVIDDEEYLEELVRGGDAILEDSGVEEGGSTKMPPVAVFGGTGDASEGGHAAMGENFLKQLRRMENQILRLQQTIKSQNSTLSALRKENDEIPRLQEKLKRANHTADHYRSRCRDRRSTLSQTLQQLEAQTCILESNCSALRSAARRVKRDLQADEVSAAVNKSQSSSRAPSLVPPRKSSMSGAKNVGGGTDSRRESDLKKETSSSELVEIKPDEKTSTSVDVVILDSSEVETTADDVICEGGVEVDLEGQSNERKLHGDGDQGKQHGQADVGREFDVNSEGSLECAPEGENGEISLPP